MPRTEKYFIGPQLLGDIRRVVGRVDGEPYRVNGVAQEVRLQDMPRSGSRLKRGTFTHASWPIGGTMVVTILGETNTVSVTNYCVPVEGQTNATQTLNVIYGNVLGTVTAVEIQQPTCTLSVGGLDLTDLPGFDATSIQLLGHAAGDTNSTACLGLQWYSVTQCGSTAA
jgi:hypothetical protein